MHVGSEPSNEEVNSICYCRSSKAFDLKARHALQDVYHSGSANGLCLLQACTRLQSPDL